MSIFLGEGLVKESTQKSGGFSYDRWGRFELMVIFMGVKIRIYIVAAKISG